MSYKDGKLLQDTTPDKNDGFTAEDDGDQDSNDDNDNDDSDDELGDDDNGSDGDSGIP